MAVKPIPDGYHTVTPYLIVKDSAAAIDFYKKAFGAEDPEFQCRGPESYGGTPVSMVIYVKDVDALAGQAVAAGAKAVRPVQDQFYGDRSGTFADPFGHVWTLATHIEDVSKEEMDKRMAAWATEHACA